MQCLSCRRDVPQMEAKLVLQLYLCSGCAALVEKGVKELELETARALEVAKHTYAQHIMRGGLLLPRTPPEDVITKVEVPFEVIEYKNKKG